MCVRADSRVQAGGAAGTDCWNERSLAAAALHQPVHPAADGAEAAQPPATGLQWAGATAGRTGAILDALHATGCVLPWALRQPLMMALHRSNYSCALRLLCGTSCCCNRCMLPQGMNRAPISECSSSGRFCSHQPRMAQQPGKPRSFPRTLR